MSDAQPIPLGLCQCGCGRATTVPQYDHSRHGYRKGVPLRFVNGHAIERPSATASVLNAAREAHRALWSAAGIDYGLCLCGCGTPTDRAPRNSGRLGWVRGEPKRFLHGHHGRTRNVPACGYVEEDHGYVTPCWVWKLSMHRAGYGWAWHDGADVLAHIVQWTKRNGPVPAGLELDHLCRVRACCNPDHLEPVTHAENMRRGVWPSRSN